MNSEPLDMFSLWFFFVLATAFSMLAIEGGYQIGKWRHSHAAGEKEAPVAAMVAALLGLLAFMLAFTFSLASVRFDARRQLVSEEANSISTTYLRAGLLPEPQRSEITKLL